ncbi:MAG: class I SAM-dependent methyltransferase [Candidatus Moranbacteria bacterium]|nr:class I SAM-dependent methyltransferase [Candidatus Moranbacteria bacterium]
MKKETVEKILSQTKHGYDMISQKFSQTRKHFWRNLEFIADFAKDGDSVLDYGCGNGRLLELFENKKINYVGVDVSQQLIDDAAGHYGAENRQFKKIDPSQTSLAFPDAYFNSIYSIAVFHHFPSEKYRQEVAKELFRATKNGGQVVVTVWYLWPAFSASWRIRRGKPAFVSLRRGKQKKYYKYVIKNWIEKLKGQSELDWNDCHISFTDNAGKKFQRFHHAFTKRELRKLFAEAGFEIQKCEVVDGRNIVLVGKKCY